MSYKTFGLLCVILFLLGAASYDNSSGAPPLPPGYQVITVTTSAVVTITLDNSDYTLIHLNIQNDGTTPSVSTDYVVTMNNQTAAGVAVTMDATYTDGLKMITLAGAACTFAATNVPLGADGPHEIQLKAVGHGCKMCLIRGHPTGNQ